jgi:hypothetical protein
VRAYYWKLFQLAFSHSVDITQAAIFVLVIVTGMTAWFAPSTREYLRQFDVAGWQVGAAVLVLILALRLVFTPYWMHSEQAKELAVAEKTLSEIAQDRPFTLSQQSTHHVIRDRLRVILSRPRKRASTFRVARGDS